METDGGMSKTRNGGSWQVQFSRHLDSNDAHQNIRVHVTETRQDMAITTVEDTGARLDS